MLCGGGWACTKFYVGGGGATQNFVWGPKCYKIPWILALQNCFFWLGRWVGLHEILCLGQWGCIQKMCGGGGSAQNFRVGIPEPKCCKISCFWTHSKLEKNGCTQFCARGAGLHKIVSGVNGLHKILCGQGWAYTKL